MAGHEVGQMDDATQKYAGGRIIRHPPFDPEAQAWPSECPSCSTYAETGMHWDTCVYRGRNADDLRRRINQMDDETRAARAGSIPQRVLVGGRIERGDPEVTALGRCVDVLEPLDAATRRRVVRYLTARYAPSPLGVLGGQ